MSYNIESVKALDEVPNIDNYSPQDFFDKLKKISVRELNLTKQREHIPAYLKKWKSKINTIIFNIKFCFYQNLRSG